MKKYLSLFFLLFYAAPTLQAANAHSDPKKLEISIEKSNKQVCNIYCADDPTPDCDQGTPVTKEESVWLRKNFLNMMLYFAQNDKDSVDPAWEKDILEQIKTLESEEAQKKEKE